MLEEIKNLRLTRKTIQREVSLLDFIYSHSITLSLLRQFKKQEGIGKTCCYNICYILFNIRKTHQEKGNLRKMFTSNEWGKKKLSKEAAKGREASKVCSYAFILESCVTLTLKFKASLINVFRFVDGERKVAMHTSMKQ